jgi:transcriptional/translational regulatory protein YebC/TACO1
MVSLTDDQMNTFEKLIEALEDDDDIDSVWDNVQREE